MSSPRQITANRANAQHSTGPRSTAGKRQSARNARKHGLAVAVSAIPELSQEVADLARAIAGEDHGNSLVLQAAVHVAEAAIDVLRVRHAKTDLLIRLSLAPDHPTRSPLEAATSVGPQEATLEIFGGTRLEQLDRYERRALSRRSAAIKAFDALRAAAQAEQS